MNGFSLKKWYLDCVDDEGRVWIGYHATLKWMGLSLLYASSIGTGPEFVERSTTRASHAPTWKENRLVWSEPRIGVTVEMRGRLEPVRRDFLRLAEGEVSWNCIAPLADVFVTLGESRRRGLGYAEILEMSVTPWSLDIGCLRWGRFTGDSTSVIWIDFDGRHPVCVGFRNGVEVGFRMDTNETRLDFDDGSTLSLSGTSKIRDEDLSRPIRRLGVIGRVVPRRFRRAREQKWSSRGTITEPDGRVFDGWAVHERVDFGG